MRNGPDTSDIHSAPIDSHILINRQKMDRQDGSFLILEVKGEMCTVLLPPSSGSKEFRSTVVKRYITESGDIDHSPTTNNGSKEEKAQDLILTVQSMGNVSADQLHSVDIEELMISSAKGIPKSKDHKKYTTFCKKDIDGLI